MCLGCQRHSLTQELKLGFCRRRQAGGQADLVTTAWKSRAGGAGGCWDQGAVSLHR